MKAATAASDPALPAGVSARALADADLEAAMALSAEAGWNQTAEDWRFFLQRGRTLCLIRHDRPIATAAILPYAPRFAWISMVLVTATQRRQGLARWLLHRCVADVVASGLVPVLDATPAGRSVYLGLGFRDAWGMRRLVGRADGGAAAANTAIAIRPLLDSDWPQLIDLDTEVFGGDRSALLQSLAQRLPRAALVADRNGRIAGFSLGRNGRVMAQLGPIVADDRDTAIALVTGMLSRVSGPVALDVPDCHVGLEQWLVARGFSAERPLTRMVYQRALAFDDTARLFAIAGPELG
jgi:GNAT superfamily N-acetyltransferase